MTISNRIQFALYAAVALGVVLVVVLRGDAHAAGYLGSAVIVLVGFLLPIAGVGILLVRSTGLDRGGALGLSGAGVIFYWMISSFVLIESGALPNRWVSAAQVLVIALVGCAGVRVLRSTTTN